MSDQHKDKSQRRERRTSKALSDGSHGFRGKETTGRTKDSISTVSCIDELGHHDDNARMVTTMENTYQLGTGFYPQTIKIVWKRLKRGDEKHVKAADIFNDAILIDQGPSKRFPAPAVTDILKDVLTNYLQEERYEVEWSQKMTKTICEVIRARVKELMIPRYKTVVLVHIGQLTGQSMQISSRCLWDASQDTFASYSFKNSSLFGLATVYAVYFE